MDGNVTDRGRNDPENAPPPRWQNIGGGGGGISDSNGRRQGFRRAVEMVLNGNITEGRQHRGHSIPCQPCPPPRAGRGGNINHANLKEQGGDNLNKQVGEAGLAGQLQHRSSTTTTEGWQHNRRRHPVSFQPFTPLLRPERSERSGGFNYANVGAPGADGTLRKQVNRTSFSEKGGENLSKQFGGPGLKGQLQHPSSICNEIPSPLSSARPPLPLAPLAQLLQPPLRAGEPPSPPPPPQYRSSVFPEREPTHHCEHGRYGGEEKIGFLERAEALACAEELVR